MRGKRRGTWSGRKNRVWRKRRKRKGTGRGNRIERRKRRRGKNMKAMVMVSILEKKRT